MNNKIISEKELADYLTGTSLAHLSAALINHQKVNWNLLRDNYKALEDIKTKVIQFDGFEIRLQFNPNRIISSNAKVDDHSIKNRKCFLCVSNLPEEQSGISYYKDYLILANPFPIFPEHFTIPKYEHLPQRIENAFPNFLHIVKTLGKFYSVFYNGPQCGASAPDHLHFQAGSIDFFPVEKDMDRLNPKNFCLLNKYDKLKIYWTQNYLRNGILLESSSENLLETSFSLIIKILKTLQPNLPEPMLNILGFHKKDKWQIFIFPRFKHRPDCFFSEDESRILLSPAAVDFGGVLILPLENDFNNITKENIAGIFREVSIRSEQFEYLKFELNKELTKILKVL